MAETFIGEIRIFAGNFAPVRWAFCDGQLLAITQNEALYSLIGSTYGGDDRTSFALPEMRGRAPVHQGQGPGLTNRLIGSRYGTERVTLTTAQIPNHSHSFQASADSASAQSPHNMVLGAVESIDNIYYQGTDTSESGVMNSASVLPTGGTQSHYNLMPYQCLNFIMSLAGTYPSRN